MSVSKVTKPVMDKLNFKVGAKKYVAQQKSYNCNYFVTSYVVVITAVIIDIPLLADLCEIFNYNYFTFHAYLANCAEISMGLVLPNNVYIAKVSYFNSGIVLANLLISDFTVNLRYYNLQGIVSIRNYHLTHMIYSSNDNVSYYRVRTLQNRIPFVDYYFYRVGNGFEVVKNNVDCIIYTITLKVYLFI